MPAHPDYGLGAEETLEPGLHGVRFDCTVYKIRFAKAALSRSHKLHNYGNGRTVPFYECIADDIA